MSTLLILLPPRERLQAGARSARAGATARASEFDWVLQRGDTLEQGRSPAAALPKADQLVLQPHALDCSFHRATLPRAPAARWRAALAGLLEEQLLEEPEQLHFALPPGAAPGQELWVCVTARAPLEQAVATLEAAQRFVDRIVPPGTPLASADETPRAHVLADEQGAPLLLLAQAEGLLLRPLRGPAPLLPAGTQCSAEPEVAAAATAQLGAAGEALPLRSRAQFALDALGSGWDLRQFELRPRIQGLQRIHQALHRFMQPAWRPVRIGLLALLGLQLVGLNALAWQQRQQIRSQQLAIDQTLTQTFPQVRAVLDAPVQMQRQMDLLRAQAGALGPQDLEPLLAAAASAWPEDRGPAEALGFEPGQLSLASAGWTEAQIELLRQRLASEGWSLAHEQGRLILRRAKN
ncbi:type II secretion system protein GspL [Inhella sp.]|uniref:type II secretion system protein GspL n=1 Tax=Inhella sp. TaxID=1921806 RepID=UPI0035AECF25